MASEQYYRPYLPSDSELSDADESYSATSSPPPEPREGSDASTPTGVYPSSSRAQGSQGTKGPQTQLPDFSALATALLAPVNLEPPAGPSFVSDTQQLAYGINRPDKRAPYSDYNAEASGQAFLSDTMAGTNVTSVIMLKSRDRYKKIFPQPTNCHLFLPRRHKNIKGISITQLNLTSSFFYFRENKSNVQIQIQENGRVVYEPNSTKTPTNTSNALIFNNSIREGSYNINELITELSTHLNKTPLFYDYLNGFSDFVSAFSVTGDLSVNFNEPGDNYYDAAKQIFIQNPTREIISKYYFQSRYSVSIDFTEANLRCAYYYPVLKEVLLDATDTTKDSLILVYPGYTKEELINYLIYEFQGIGDTIADSVIVANITANTVLDTYRLLHTFRYSLVNSYTCTYNPTNLRVKIYSDSLNTSLKNMLIAQYNSYLTQQLILNGITLDYYNGLSFQITSDLAIIQEMYDFMQGHFATYFAIDFGTFHRSYYTNSNYTVQLRPGLYATNVQKVYAGTNPKSRTNDIMNDLKDTPPSYWPYMSNLGNVVSELGYNMGSPRTSYPTSWNHPYMLAYSNMDIFNDFVNSNGEIYTDYRRKAGDIMVNVEAGKYTIFKFKSKLRQSLQVESLPRQTAYRYPAWNKSHPVPYPVDTLFDISYCFIDPRHIPVLSNHILTDISYNAVYGWSTMTNAGKDNMWNYSTNYSATYTESSAFWGTNLEQLNTTNPGGRVYRFIAPYPVDSNVSGSNVYTYDYNITISAFTPTLSTPTPTTFKEDFNAFFYHEESALAADISAAGSRKESPYFYKSKITMASGTGSNTYTFKAYAGQTYFMLLRPSSISPPATYYTVVPWTANTCNVLSYETNFTPTADPMTMLSNFHVAKNADPAFIRMPVSTIYTDKDDTPKYDSNSSSNTIIQKYNKPLQIANTPIGYDKNGISTDMTDYIPYQPYGNFSNIDPDAKTRIDPLTNYVFAYNTPYSDTEQSYFPRGGQNFIKTVNGENNYTPAAVTERQYKIVQNYGTTYLKGGANISYSPTDISPYIPPYTKSTTNGSLGGSYTYNAANELNLGAGVCGFTFLPGDGIWNIERLTFKSNFTSLSKSLNNDIHCIAVFFTSDIHPVPTSFINLQNAVAICLRVKDTTYTANTIQMGFDSALGTYHTFSNYPSQVTRQNFQISGYTQTGKQFITDINSYYSAIAIKFQNIGSWDTSAVDDISIQNQIRTAISNPSLISVVNIQNLVGSPIPYPFGGIPSVSNAFYDGKTAPTDENVVVSSAIPAGNKYGPPTGYDESVSKYEQSQEIVNSHIHYLSPLNIITDPNGFSTWDGLTVDLPDYIHASVYDPTSISSDGLGNSWRTAYAIIQGPAFSLVTYKIFDRIALGANPSRTFTYKGQLSAQQIFPDGEETSIIAVTGNTSRFVFLGATNSNATQSSVIRLKTYDPTNGSLVEFEISPDYTFHPATETMQHFVYNDSNFWFYTVFVNEPLAVGIKLVGSYSNNLFSKFYAGYTMSELQMPPDGNNLYFAKYNDLEGGFSNLTIYPLRDNTRTPDDNLSVLSNAYTINLDTSPILDPSPLKFYKQFAVANNRGTEEVLLTNTDYDKHVFYKIRSYLTTTTSNTSNTNIDFSKQTLSNVGIRRIMAGAQGSKWILLDNSPYIMGNRNDVVDAPTSLSLAWQIFFPTMKIEMRNVSANYTPITDLTNITYSEWPHVAMFAYSNFTSLSNDILTDGGKWGLESNFVTSDLTFDGYDFNSYLLNFPLQSNANSLNSNDYYYLAVRGYLPTESFQTMMRFYVPKRYDFGFATFTDMIKEVVIIDSQANSFNPVYRKALSSFNGQFVFENKIFGSNSISGLAGSNISSTSFSNFLDQYNTFYTRFLSNSDLLTIIQNNLKNSITNFMKSNLQYILPQYALTRQQFTDPLTFRILWKDNLTTAYADLDDEWGLGWNLGYAKENTPYSTAHTANSFFKIQQDFIYLRLNPELNINALDVGAKEDYEASREGSGITSRYYCKLLLTNFGGNATTFIHNPISFDPPIRSLTKLQFQWVDSTGAIIDNNDSEWSMTVNITENIPSAPTMKDIAAFQPANPKTGLPAGLPKEFQEPKAQAQGNFAAAKEAEALAAEKQAMYDAVDKRTMRAGKSQVKS
jgi:hypothetical protein